MLSFGYQPVDIPGNQEIITPHLQQLRLVSRRVTPQQIILVNIIVVFLRSAHMTLLNQQGIKVVNRPHNRIKIIVSRENWVASCVSVSRVKKVEHTALEEVDRVAFRVVEITAD